MARRPPAHSWASCCKVGSRAKGWGMTGDTGWQVRQELQGLVAPAGTCLAAAPTGQLLPPRPGSHARTPRI